MKVEIAIFVPASVYERVTLTAARSSLINASNLMTRALPPIALSMPVTKPSAQPHKESKTKTSRRDQRLAWPTNDHDGSQ